MRTLQMSASSKTLLLLPSLLQALPSMISFIAVRSCIQPGKPGIGQENWDLQIGIVFLHRSLDHLCD